MLRKHILKALRAVDELESFIGPWRETDERGEIKEDKEDTGRGRGGAGDWGREIWGME
jgi:hypothetical protein